MSTKTFDALSTLNKARTNWKIKVKVIRKWRGATTTGEHFKAFNIIAIDKEVIFSRFYETYN